ncbi:MAG: hypothetical protein K0S41_3617 [Anaerocolumna sp.]|nr:hypothetical protein [Anaerocolumna sp.]
MTNLNKYTPVLNYQSFKSKEPLPQPQTADLNSESYFSHFTGIVREINILNYNFYSTNYVLVENSDGEIANLIISEDTYFVYDGMITVGSIITGYFPTNAPVPLIYPPQYYVMVVKVEPVWQQIKVDYFDDDLVSADGVLKLEIGDHTNIITQDGEPYTGDLENRLLVVYYGVSTRSIPAIAIPLQVVVLDAMPSY